MRRAQSKGKQDITIVCLNDTGERMPCCYSCNGQSRSMGAESKHLSGNCRSKRGGHWIAVDTINLPSLLFCRDIEESQRMADADRDLVSFRRERDCLAFAVQSDCCFHFARQRCRHLDFALSRGIRDKGAIL